MPQIFNSSIPLTPLFIGLRQDGESVILEIVDEKGAPVTYGLIAKITTNGILTRHPHISSDVAKRAGISITEEGRIVTA